MIRPERRGQHRRQHPLGHHEHAAQVHPHQPVPVPVGDVEERRDAGDARVVDQDLDRAEFLLDPGDRLVRGVPVGHVEPDAQFRGRPGQPAGHGRGGGAVQVADGHRGARGRQHPRDPGPDPGGAAGDQRGLPGQPGHRAFGGAFCRGVHPAASWRAGSTCLAISSSDAVALLDRHTRRPGPEDQLLVPEPLLAGLDGGQDVVGRADEIVLGRQDRGVGQRRAVRVVVAGRGEPLPVGVELVEEVVAADLPGFVPAARGEQHPVGGHPGRPGGRGQPGPVGVVEVQAGAGVRHEAHAVPGGPAGRGQAVAADPDRRAGLLHRRRPDHHVVEPEVPCPRTRTARPARPAAGSRWSRRCAHRAGSWARRAPRTRPACSRARARRRAGRRRAGRSPRGPRPAAAGGAAGRAAPRCRAGPVRSARRARRARRSARGGSPPR